MSVLYNISLDIKGASCGVDTIYTKENTQGIQLVAEISNSGTPFDMSNSVVTILSNYKGYVTDQSYPHTATISGVHHNIATFDLTGVFDGGWTICSIRITKLTGQSTTEIYETPNFQIFSEGSPNPSSGSSTDPIYIPTASTNIKGGIKVGSGLSMTGEVLNADVGATQIAEIESQIANRCKINSYPMASAVDKTAYLRITANAIGTATAPSNSDLIRLYCPSGVTIPSFYGQKISVVLTVGNQTYTLGADNVSFSRSSIAHEGQYGSFMLYCRSVDSNRNAQCYFVTEEDTSRLAQLAFSMSHTHTNKSVIDKFSYDNGLKYDGNSVGVKAVSNVTIDFDAKTFGMYGECVTAYNGDASSSLPANSEIVDVGLVVGGVERRLSKLASYNFATSEHTIISQINDSFSNGNRLLFTLMSSVYEDSISNQISVHPIVQDIADGTLYECKVYYTSGA